MGGGGGGGVSYLCSGIVSMFNTFKEFYIV